MVDTDGASEGIRTLDTHVGNVMLYQAELRSLPVRQGKNYGNPAGMQVLFQRNPLAFDYPSFRDGLGCGQDAGRRGFSQIKVAGNGSKFLAGMLFGDQHVEGRYHQ